MSECKHLDAHHVGNGIFACYACDEDKPIPYMKLVNRLRAHISELDAIAFTDRENACSMALRQGFSTGHADTLHDLLIEVEPQIDSLRARIAQLKAENAALKNPWQPIETAPQDGTEIIGMASKYKEVFLCRYWSGEQIAEHEGFGVADDYMDGWYLVNDCYSEACPDYWGHYSAPLPTPPQGEATMENAE